MWERTFLELITPDRTLQYLLEKMSISFDDSISAAFDIPFPIESFQPHDIPHSTANTITKVKDPQVKKKKTARKQALTQRKVCFKTYEFIEISNLYPISMQFSQTLNPAR